MEKPVIIARIRNLFMSSKEREKLINLQLNNMPTGKEFDNLHARYYGR